MSTTLDFLRATLDHLDGESRAHQLNFFRGVLEAGSASVPELEGRLPGSRAPRALRLLSLEASFYYPWPEWVPLLSRILRYEPDHGIFSTGARALGRIGTKAALEALRELNTLRQGDEFKEVLAGVLTETDPREAFNHYLGKLLQGSANPGVANEAAEHLSALADGSHLGELSSLAQHPDLLVFRHGLLLLGKVRTAEAAELIAGIFEDSHQEVLGDRQLKETLGQYRAMAPAAARDKARETMRAVNAGEIPDFPPVVKAFLRDLLAAVEGGKPGQMGGALAEAVDGLHQRSRRLGFAVDATAEGLVALVGEGLIDASRVLDLLVEGYRQQTGREGLARALAQLVPLDAEAIHGLILQGPDAAQRAAAVEVLGARREAGLQGVLLRACADPMTDVADRALFHLGVLPGAQELARDLMASGNPQDLNLGLRLVSQQGFRDLAPDLVALVKAGAREETLVQIIEALGKLGGGQAADQLMEMLHSGQSPRIQGAVAQAILELRDPGAALFLCSRANEIKSPLIHALAVEALVAAHGTAQAPLPDAQGPLLLLQVRKAWMDRNPWALRLRVVLALRGLYLAHGEIWAALGDLVRDTLAEKRPTGAWNPEALHQVQAAAREFTRRGSGQDPFPEA